VIDTNIEICVIKFNKQKRRLVAHYELAQN